MDKKQLLVTQNVILHVHFLYRKKRSQPAPVNERHKPVNSYARMFAAQKQKKAKEAKEIEGKIVENVEPDQDGGATDRLNPQVHHQVHMDASGYSSHPSVGLPVDNAIHPSYDAAFGMYSHFNVPECSSFDFAAVVTDCFTA